MGNKGADIIDEKTYLEPFLASKEKDDAKLVAALERAWKNRDFEIDKYWSRATYFWAFIAASFVGYITIENSIKLQNPEKARLAFIICCLGTVFSVAWVLVNLGSKKWQENWEKHIDMLEDYVTGPLYKTVFVKNRFSVSRVNIIVSGFVTAIWLLLAVLKILKTTESCAHCSIDLVILSSASLTILCIGIFFLPKVGGKPYQFKRRGTNYKPVESATGQGKVAEDGIEQEYTDAD